MNGKVWVHKVLCLSLCPSGWRRPCWEGMWPSLDPWDVVGLRTTATVWNVAKNCGPCGELFIFLTEKEPTEHEKVVGFEQRDTEEGMSSSEEKVSTMWRTSCCVPLRIMSAVLSCKNPYTRKSCVSWP